MTHRFFLKLWPEMWLGATVTTRKQNKHRASGKTPNSPKPKKARQVRSNVKIVLISFFFMLMELCTRNLFLLDELWINNFIWRGWKDYATVYGKNDKKCGAAVIGSFTTTVPLPTRPSEVQQFLAKNNKTLVPRPPNSPDLAPCDFSLFPPKKG